jgi:hypothetical protein
MYITCPEQNSDKKDAGGKRSCTEKRLCTVVPICKQIWGAKNFVDGTKKLTRMIPADFELLINLVRPKIVKMHARFRAAIPVQERLAVTLRFLATGDSYTRL